MNSTYFVDFNRYMLFSRQSEVQKWKFEQNLETNYTPRGFA